MSLVVFNFSYMAFNSAGFFAIDRPKDSNSSLERGPLKTVEKISNANRVEASRPKEVTANLKHSVSIFWSITFGEEGMFASLSASEFFSSCAMVVIMNAAGLQRMGLRTRDSMGKYLRAPVKNRAVTIANKMNIVKMSFFSIGSPDTIVIID
jgi:hypothetical protein